jgi:hypothetical protein
VRSRCPSLAGAFFGSFGLVEPARALAKVLNRDAARRIGRYRRRNREIHRRGSNESKHVAEMAGLLVQVAQALAAGEPLLD